MDWMGYLPHPALWAGLGAMLVAQALKPVFQGLRGGGWDWRLVFEDGHMPSSHAALITATTHALGLFEGFDSPLFALAVVLAIIVLYDAANVRWQTGVHARWLNRLLRRVFRNPRVPQEPLDEVVGHTPWEVFWGIVVGLAVAQGLSLFWPLPLAG